MGDTTPSIYSVTKLYREEGRQSQNHRRVLPGARSQRPTGCLRLLGLGHPGPETSWVVKHSYASQSARDACS